MNKILKIIATTLISLFILAPLPTKTVEASSGFDSIQKNKNDNPITTRAAASTHINIADGSSGSRSMNIYVDYPVGDSYPKVLYNYKHWDTYFEKYIYGNMYFSDIYPLHNGYVRVWYHGELY